MPVCGMHREILNLMISNSLCLGVSDPPWESIPYDTDQFIQLYALPWADHHNGRDQYLFP